MSWFVRNVRDVKWWDRGPRGFVTELVDDDDPQVGVNLFVLGPGQPMAMYHWEADQEGFLVLSGEALLDRRGRGEAAAGRGTTSTVRPSVPHTIVGARLGAGGRSSPSARVSTARRLGRLSRTPRSR